jgi:hypothetical protein
MEYHELGYDPPNHCVEPTHTLAFILSVILAAVLLIKSENQKSRTQKPNRVFFTRDHLPGSDAHRKPM